jgi:hypothetical protein
MTSVRRPPEVDQRGHQWSGRLLNPGHGLCVYLISRASRPDPHRGRIVTLPEKGSLIACAWLDLEASHRVPARD